MQAPITYRAQDDGGQFSKHDHYKIGNTIRHKPQMMPGYPLQSNANPNLMIPRQFANPLGSFAPRPMIPYYSTSHAPGAAVMTHVPYNLSGLHHQTAGYPVPVLPMAQMPPHRPYYHSPPPFSQHMNHPIPRIPEQLQQRPFVSYSQLGKIPALPDVVGVRANTGRNRSLSSAASKGSYHIALPKIRHELMHIAHSEKIETRPHAQYPEHMTTIRIRTPSQWGPSRIGTPIELRSSMSTIERYRLNPPKYIPPIDYEPYSHADYLALQSRYQNMKLPRGLGPSDNERWQREHEKRERMREYSNKLKGKENELKNNRRRRRNDTTEEKWR